VAALTQKQALSALLFLYREGLRKDLDFGQLIVDTLPFDNAALCKQVQVDQPAQPALLSQRKGMALDLGQGNAGAVQGAQHAAHARAGYHVDGHALPLQYLQDADVGQSPGTPLPRVTPIGPGTSRALCFTPVIFSWSSNGVHGRLGPVPDRRIQLCSVRKG
jgi:hypothetical protein